MIKKIFIFALFSLVLTGCANVSPFSPKQNNRVNNQGSIEDIKSNQNGLMADLANVRGKLELMARDVENLQQGLINSNNKNYGVQIFQGEGGLLAGICLFSFLGYLIYNYRSQAVKYKKTAEIMAKEIKSIKNIDLENKIYTSALNNKIEENVYKMLKN